MLRYEFVNKELIVSRAARRVYRVAAALSVVLFLFLWASLSPDFHVPAVLAPLVKLLLFAGILGAATSMVGMEFFLFRFDQSPALKQVLWFLVMLAPLVGAPLYCFVVYSRAVPSDPDRAKAANV